MRVRVATYNIRKCVGLDWRRDPDRILRVIGELGADVVALQEADRRFGKRIATIAGHALGDAGWRSASVAVHAGGMGWHGNAMLLGPDVEVDDASRIPLPALEPRGAVLVEGRVRGRSVRLVGTHLGLTPGRRSAQARAIVAALHDRAPRPTVVMGDMNEWRTEAGCIAVLSRALTFAAPVPTFHAGRPVSALDRIAVGGGVTICGSGAHASPVARRASDHLPLWADLVLPDP